MRLNPADIPEVSMQFMHDVHLEEVDMLNELYELIEQVEAGKDVPELEEKVDALLSHTIAHFKGEDEKMQELHFPPYVVHKHEHDRLLEEFGNSGRKIAGKLNAGEANCGRSWSAGIGNGERKSEADAGFLN